MKADLSNAPSTPNAGRAESEVSQARLLEFIGYNCRQATMVITPPFTKRMTKLGIRRMEFAILMLVRDNERINQKALADALHVAPPNLNLVLDRLESIGWLERFRNPADKRSQFLRLTARGLRKCAIAEKAAVEAEAECAAALTVAEGQELVRLLKKLHLRV